MSPMIVLRLPSQSMWFICSAVVLLTFLSIFYDSLMDKESVSTQKYMSEILRKRAEYELSLEIVDDTDSNKTHHMIEATSTNNTNPTSNRAIRLHTTPELSLNMSVWKHNTASKLQCLLMRRGGLYLYHVRKAAGTSMRVYLKRTSIYQRVPYFETEGRVLNEQLLHVDNLVTIITLR